METKTKTKIYDDPVLNTIQQIRTNNIDSMNNTMGQDTIRFAAQGIDHPWARKCENRKCDDKNEIDLRYSIL